MAILFLTFEAFQFKKSCSLIFDRVDLKVSKEFTFQSRKLEPIALFCFKQEMKKTTNEFEALASLLDPENELKFVIGI